MSDATRAGAGKRRGPRPSATEMVGVPLSSTEAQRLLDALTAGSLGNPNTPENLVLHRKLTVALQVALATEKRRGV